MSPNRNNRVQIVWLYRYLGAVGHKLVGLGYAFVGVLGALLGFILSVLIRVELLSPGLGLIRSVKSAWAYNSWISVHGLVMLFGFVMPVVIGGFGNYLLPLLLGCSELVMPRYNGLSLWLLILGVVILSTSQLLFTRPLCCGWTLYPPLSTRDADSLSISTDLSLFCVHILGISSALGSFNYLATVFYQRHSSPTSTYGL